MQSSDIKLQETTESFWNNIYAKNKIEVGDESDSVLLAAINHFGNIQGASLLDIGCGNGTSSLFFAKHGANVTAVDISEVAINNLQLFCQENNISNICPTAMSAFNINNLGKFDFVFGNLILHHLEPFDLFASILRQSIADGGKAFFHENSAVSDLLIWFRNNLVGKYGIPKYGDDDEFPLTPQEVEIMKKYFTVEVDNPELVFFGLVSVYLLKGKFHKALKGLDDYLYRFPTARKYSYRQYLLLS